MPKLRRRRRILTCEYCYNHKLKCDRNQPCSTCIRTKHDCVYHFKDKIDPHAFNSIDDDYTGHVLQTVPKVKDDLNPDIVAAYENVSNELTKKISIYKEKNDKNDKNDISNDDINANTKSNDTTSTSKASKAKNSKNTSIETNNKKNSSKVPKKVQLKESNNPVFMSNISNTPLYYSRAFFPYLEPSLNRMMLFKMSEVGESGQIKNDFSHIGTYDFQRFGLPITLDQLVEEYPKKESFDDIIYLYWDYIHPLIPIIDREITMNNYIRFWKDLNDPENPRFDIDSGVLFLAMLLAVKTAFEVNEKDPSKLKLIQDEKSRVYDTFEKFKLIFGFRTNPNLAYIQSSIILFQSSCIYYIGIFTYTASLARQSEFMGLHRDPLLHDVYPNTKNIKDIEVRRLVWHYVRFLDTSASIVSGMSPHMIMTNASTKFPSKYDYNHETNKFDGDLNPFMVFTISRFKCSLVMETISHFLNSDFSSDNERLLRWEGIAKTVVALYQDVNTLVKEIFSCESNPKYSKILLRWLVSNAAIFVHRTYLLHRACDRRPYSHHNRVILKPANAANVELTKLSQASSNKDFFNKVLTLRMPYFETTIEVSILVLYETKIRVGVSPELSKYRWFTKNANPFQYIYFVIRDIYHYPTKRYNLNNLPEEIKRFIFEDELLDFTGDVRKYVVDLALTSLSQLKDFWCEPINDMMNFLCELKKYVYRCTESSNNSSNSNSNINQKKNTNNMNMNSNLNNMNMVNNPQNGTNNVNVNNSKPENETIKNRKNDHDIVSMSNNIGKSINDSINTTGDKPEDFDLLMNSEFEMDKYKNVIGLISSFNPEQMQKESPAMGNISNSSSISQGLISTNNDLLGIKFTDHSVLDSNANRNNNSNRNANNDNKTLKDEDILPRSPLINETMLQIPQQQQQQQQPQQRTSHSPFVSPSNGSYIKSQSNISRSDTPQKDSRNSIIIPGSSQQSPAPIQYQYQYQQSQSFSQPLPQHQQPQYLQQKPMISQISNMPQFMPMQQLPVQQFHSHVSRTHSPYVPNMQNISNMQNMQNIQNIQNMQGMPMQGMQNFQGMQNGNIPPNMTMVQNIQPGMQNMPTMQSMQSMQGMHGMQNMQGMQGIQNIQPGMQTMPSMQSMPSMPSIPSMPSMGSMGNMGNIPGMSNLPNSPDPMNPTNSINNIMGSIGPGSNYN